MTSKQFLETLIRDVLVKHLEQKSLNTRVTRLSTDFRKGCSCLTNLLTFLDKVTVDSVNMVHLPRLRESFRRASTITGWL